MVEFAGDSLHEISSRPHGLQFRGLEPDPEPGFGGHHKRDVSRRVPSRNFAGGYFRRKRNRVVVENVLKHFGQGVEDFGWLHG